MKMYENKGFLRFRPNLGRTLASLVLAIAAAPVWALDRTTLTNIHETIKDYLAQEVVSRYQTEPDITVRRLDPRLKLKACDQPLQAELRRGSKLVGTTSVAVSCNTGNRWKIYVQADIKVILNIVVADAMLERGQLISDQDLKLEAHDIGSLPQGFFDNTGQVAGMMARRTIKPGDLINSHMLKRPYMVKRGESVNLIVQTPGLRVQMKGKALGNATKGNNVKVQNLSSKRVVEGIAVAPGVVSISLN